MLSGMQEGKKDGNMSKSTSAGTGTGTGAGAGTEQQPRTKQMQQMEQMEQVMEYSRGVAWRVPDAELRRRLDLRHKRVVSIDPPGNLTHSW